MARIKLRPGTTADPVLETVRETFAVRDYHWDQTGAHSAIASEGGTPVSDAALAVSHRLRIAVRIQLKKNRLILRQETVGAAYTGAAIAAGGGPWLHLQLSSRFRKIVTAVREDLAAAALR